MKTHIRAAFKHAIRDRNWVIGAIVLVALSLLLALILLLQIRPSDLQLPVHYTSYGTTNFYRDKWYYLLGFVLFAIFVMLMNIAISLKLYEQKGRELSILFLGLSIAIIAIAFLTTSSLFRIALISQ